MPGNNKQRSPAIKFRVTFFVVFILYVSSSAQVTPDNLNYFLKTSGNRPYGIAFDNIGSMFIVTAPDTGKGKLSKVTPDGNITDIAEIKGNFIGPGIFIDNEKSVYITTGDKLLRFSAEGKATVVAYGFSRAIDVKIDKNKNIYVADDLRGTIYKITSTGSKGIFYKSDTAGSFILTGIILNKSCDKLYAREGNKLLMFNLISDSIASQPKVIIDNTKMFYLCIDKNDNIYASTLNNVIEVDTAGKIQFLSTAVMGTSLGLAIGGKGFDENSLYITVEDGIIKLPILGSYYHK
jgi:DNA-binding beta-propeller fold protein YncE